MILREATIKYKGYDPDLLTKGSHKRICISCDICGRVKYIAFCQYKNTCRNCLYKSGEDHSWYGRKHTNKSKQKISNTKTGIKLSKEHKNKISKSLIGNKRTLGYKHSKETKKRMSESSKGVIFTKEHREKISKALIKHHYIYDHNDLTKYTMLITRKQHGRIHANMKKMGIKVPHINL